MNVETLTLDAQNRLTACGVPEASANAEFLMAATLGVKRGELRSYADFSLKTSKRLVFQQRISRRAKRYPLSYVLGTHDFMGMELRVTPDVLIPRPETELLVEAVLGKLSDSLPTPCLTLPTGRQAARQAVPSLLHILDIGTGSGCIALALARRLPQARVIGVDISREALKVAASNARRHGLEDRVSFVRADFFGKMPLRRSWADVLVSNPPYIPSQRLKELEPEVLREPRLALDGGRDGLQSIRAVIHLAPELLRPGGFLVLEIDDGQGPAVRALMKETGFDDVGTRSDLSGFERIVLGRLQR